MFNIKIVKKYFVSYKFQSDETSGYGHRAVTQSTWWKNCDITGISKFIDKDLDVTDTIILFYKFRGFGIKISK